MLTSFRKLLVGPLATPAPIVAVRAMCTQESPAEKPNTSPEPKSIDEKKEEENTTRFIVCRNFFILKGRNATHAEKIELFEKYDILPKGPR